MIRLARRDDAEDVLAIYAPVVRETIISFELEPPTEAEMRKRISDTLEMFPWLVFERDGRVVGNLHIDRTASASRTSGPPTWRATCTPSSAARGSARSSMACCS